jgi:hypothetical protein
VRTPYERHYLLLGAVHTRFVFLQAAFQLVFTKLEPLEVLENYSTPKLRTLLQILRRFDLTRPLEPFKPKIILDEDDDDKDGFEDEESFEPQTNVDLTQTKRNKERRRKFDPSKKSRTGKSRKKLPTEEEQDSGIQKVQVEENVNAAANDPDSLAVAPHSGMTNGHMEDGDVVSASEMLTATEEESKVVEDEVELPQEEKTESFKTRRPKRYPRRSNRPNRSNEQPLCGIVFMDNRFDARILYVYRLNFE